MRDTYVHVFVCAHVGACMRVHVPRRKAEQGRAGYIASDHLPRQSAAGRSAMPMARCDRRFGAM